ncbi:MAG: FAD-dependent oxidoreductase [Deltaproteobacteria bacterium]|nr:FAD-dependent oxidoreductase [Deltaproteobacteria bacterium]
MRDARLDILFEPLVMPNMVLKNRLFMAPMGTTFIDPVQFNDYLVARALGGVALITTGEICVDPGGGVGVAGEPHLYEDDDIGIFEPVVKAVQRTGARIVAQLNHAGRYSFGHLLGCQPVAPSPVPSRYSGEVPRELSTEEADGLVHAFAQAARRARDAGFDGIELCGCSGYLISQFLSPLTNQREDKYGGDTMQRALFLLSIIREIRRLTGKDFNISVKFDGEDGMKGGRTLEDSLLVAPELVRAGADRLHIWAGWHEAPRPMLPHFVPRGAFSHLAAAVKDVVNVPVATVGRINDPFVAADILRKGDADLIGLARALLCDPEFAVKAEEGRCREIRKCTACCHCFDQIMRAMLGEKNVSLTCALNPELGREGNPIGTAGVKKRVVVVGGGPSGMEAARVAALRGHDVTLFEGETALGGMLTLACKPPFKEELQNIIDYYTCQMELLPVKVRLGETFTEELLQEIKPDVVILAAGAEEQMLPIPGIERDAVVTAVEVLRESVEVGTEVIVVGGGMIGVETAEFLADRGKRVTLVEMMETVAGDVGFAVRWGMLSRIKKKVAIHTSTKAVSIGEGFITVEDRQGEKRDIPADTVVVAVGLAPVNELTGVLERAGIEYYSTGSCREPGQVAEAVSDAYAVGCRI